MECIYSLWNLQEATREIIQNIIDGCVTIAESLEAVVKLTFVLEENVTHRMVTMG